MNNQELRQEMQKMAESMGLSNEEFDALMCKALADIDLDELHAQRRAASASIGAIRDSIGQKLVSGARRTHGSLKFPV